MAKLSIKRGSLSNIIRVFIQDNTKTYVCGLTGLTSASVNLQIAVMRLLAATPTVYKVSTSTIETIATIGIFAQPSSGKCRFKAVDATNMPGWHEIQFRDDANFFGNGDASNSVAIYIREVTTTALKIAFEPVEIELTAVDNQDSIRMGLTSLPNAAAQSSGGLFTMGTGAGQINQSANGQIDSKVVTMPPGIITSSVIASGAIAKGTQLTGLNDLSLANIEATTVLAKKSDVTNLNNLSLTNIESSNVIAKKTDISGLNNIALSQIEGSTVLAKKADIIYTGVVKRNQALNNYKFHLELKTGGNCPDQLVVAYKNIDASTNFVPCDNVPTFISDGWFSINMTANDFNGKVIALRFTSENTIPCNVTIVTQD